tara:strand:- start:1235 stop:1555 length:321 start_codon:yes stop_codon:yes gene_type:complete
MPLTWSQATESWQLVTYTWEEVALALEIALFGGGKSQRRKEELYGELFREHPDKKKRFINLILKVKGQEIKETSKVPMDMDITLSDIDLVIKEVLESRPQVKINVA